MTTKTTETPADAITTPGVDPSALADLSAPTPAEEIKQRQAWGRGGAQMNADGTPKMLDYVDARYVQERLDAALGPENWQTKYEDVGPDGGAVRCGIGILIRGIGWVWKWDVGVPSNIEPEKGAHSDAFKRAAVQWGVARDLYSNREDRMAEEAGAPVQGTVRQQVNGGGRQQRYGGGGEPQALTPPPNENPPDCAQHGQMVHRSGSKNGRNWSGFFCSVQGCTTPPVWLGGK